ncbi:AraC family transcriptional regulator [Fodinicola feengrottensis]|uniref:AraC family transcriptional regulator n=1 Tax=Fodinicola feengrottensis TaxID=435914 RepID=A0ABN2J039_9ACTN
MPPASGTVQMGVRHWPGMRSEYAWLPPTVTATQTKPYQIGVSFTAHRTAIYGLDGRLGYSDIRAGAVFVTGAEEITWASVREPSESLEIYPSQDLLRSLGGSLDAIEPAMAVADATVLAVASMLRRAHLTGTAISDVAASTVAHRLGSHLLERYGGLRLRRRVGRLPLATVDRVAEFVDAGLAGPLTLDALATVATLSPYHFARGFKATTGMAPHQFVTSRRIDRARALLLDTPSSVADIARAVGLSNVRHFRQLFRAQLGVLPGQLRRKPQDPTL